MDAQDKQKEGDKEFWVQPIKECDGSVDAKVAALKAPPGPVVAQEMPPQEGTREDREARKEVLNN